MTMEDQQATGAAEPPESVQPPAWPLVFGDCAGLLHPAGGDVGVVLCSPWGYEELCARKTWRRLGDGIAAAGYHCLRFDYPGTGDSLGGPADVAGLSQWVDAVVQAADTLAAAAGVSRIVLVGQGLGAALATLAAPRIKGFAGLALLAPVLKGRAYLREIGAWSAMIASANNLQPDASGAGVSIAGFDLPAAVAADLKRLDATAALAAAPAAPALVLARAGRAADASAAEALSGLRWTVTLAEYEGLDGLLTDPTMAVAPVAALGHVVDWLVQTAPLGQFGAARPVDAPAVLQGDGFSEEAFRFGEGLLGVLCRPAGLQVREAVVMLNGGYDHHIGWARLAVDHARALAASGIASLRLDGANIGDSPPRPEAPEQVLYAPLQVQDVIEAVDAMEDRGFDRITLVGRCSGAFVGLTAAAIDARVGGLIMVNALRFVWDPAETVDEAIRFRSFGHYKAKAMQTQTLKRVLAGEVDVAGVASRLARQGLKTAADSVSSLFGRNPAGELLSGALHRFALLRDRGVGVSLAYSDSEEEGLQRFGRVFGRDGARLANFPNMTVSTIQGADHNLTPRPARDWLLAHIIAHVQAQRTDQSRAA